MASDIEQYALLSHKDCANDDEYSHIEQAIRQRRQSAVRPTKVVLISTLVIVFILSNMRCLGQKNRLDTSNGDDRHIDKFPIVPELPERAVQFEWFTAWGVPETNSTTGTDSVVDALWDGVLPSHGIVSVDRGWAAQQDWPISMYHPTDNDKGVYLLEAYHMIHCLTIIRLSLTEARKGVPLTWHESHALHCFDALRQSIQCHADATPLYSFGDGTAGDGQVRQCKDWNALRDWATEHSACYQDSVEHIPLKDYFVRCPSEAPYQNGSDGLP